MCSIVDTHSVDSSTNLDNQFRHRKNHYLFLHVHRYLNFNFLDENHFTKMKLIWIEWIRQHSMSNVDHKKHHTKINFNILSRRRFVLGWKYNCNLFFFSRSFQCELRKKRTHTDVWQMILSWCFYCHFRLNLLQNHKFRWRYRMS